MKKYETFLYSAAGLAALFFLLVALNYLASPLTLRADLTQGQIYTLSPATRAILKKLDAPVTLRLYISKGEDAVPVQLRGFAQRVEDMVQEFKSAADGKLIVEKFNPTPDSDEEDAAQLDGIEPQTLLSGGQFYLGLTVSQLDRKQTIAAISPQREQLLEYDLIRAIANVANPEKPTIGVMSALPVLGGGMDFMTRQPSEPWALANELERDYKVERVSMSAKSIGKNIKVLLLIEPRGISAQTEYALDQFVLRGGKLVAFVDPYMVFDREPNPMMPQLPGEPGSSSLPVLFKAWGVSMYPGKVVADLRYASGAGQRYTPTVLTLNKTALNKSDIATNQIRTLLYAFGGAFDISKLAPGLKATVLARSSPDSMLVDAFMASASGNAATRDFQPGGKSMPLALRLSGKFKTAFPKGPPAAPGAAAGKNTEPGDSTPQLKQSTGDNSVVLVGDADMLADGAAVDEQDIFGHRVVVPSNGNLAFAEGIVDQLASADDLTSLRSRASSFRPLIVVQQMEAEAQKRYLGKIKALQDELEQTNEKLRSLRSPAAGAKSAQILTPAQQAELDHFRKRVLETRHELKEVRKTLRQDVDALQFWTKVVNIAAMPLLVALFGLAYAGLRRRRARIAKEGNAT
jgi:gliding motility-associatede transport system auxiliary component